MARTTTSAAHRHAKGIADAAAREEETLRDRWEARQSVLRERFDEPIERATEITRRTLAWFPIRVWRHFLQRNGFLLAAGISYQTIFSAFAAIYVAFALAGMWLGGSAQAVDGLISIINSFIPHLIETDGIISPEQVHQIATGSAGVLGTTGIIAGGTLVWTAVGSVTFSRRAVRDMFGLPPDRRSYIRLKSADFLGAFMFGIGLVAAGLLNLVGSGALKSFYDLFGWSTDSFWFGLTVRLSTAVVGLVLNTMLLAGLFRFLTGTQLHWRRVWPGALLGGGAMTVLQLAAGFLLTRTPANLLLATFAVFVGLLLWFRLFGIVMLVAAAWVGVATTDRNLPLTAVSDADRLAAEHKALLTAAQVRLRTARQAQEAAPWFRRWSAARRVRDAQEELARVEASAPAAPAGRAGSAHGRHRAGPTGSAMS